MKIHVFDNRINADEHALNLDRGFLFGDGFFTTGVIEQGRLRNAQKHYQRLCEAANRLGFSLFEFSQFKLELDTVIEDIEQACIRITVSRQQLMRGYYCDDRAPIGICVQLSDLPPEPDHFCQLFIAQTPASANPLLAGLKHLNRLDSVMAAREIKLPCQEAVMCLKDQVIGGSRSNLFVFHHQQWFTPNLNEAGVAGLTRDRVLHAMELAGIEVKQTEINRQQLVDCEAAFVTNSLVGFWPVESIQGNNLNTDISVNLQSQLDFKR